jgi:hypothetical protein
MAYQSSSRESQKKHLFEHPSSIVFDRKFDTAIRQSHISRILQRKKDDKLTFNDKLIFENHLFDENLELVSTPDFIARFLLNLQSKKLRVEKKGFKEILPRIRDLVKENINLQANYMIDTIKHPQWLEIRRAKLHRFLVAERLDPFLATLLCLIQDLDKIVDRLNDMKHHKYSFMTEEDRQKEFMRMNRATLCQNEVILIWNYDTTLIKMDNRLYLLPQSYILMIHNKLCDITSVLFLASYSLGATLPNNSLDVIHDFLREMCQLMIRYKNKYFEIAKVLEGLCYAETLRIVESWPNIEFLTELKDSLLTEVGWEYEGSNLCLLLRQADHPMRHELACLSKVIGHPLVEMESGARTIHKKVTEVYELDYKRLAECECYIKQNYIRNHIAAGKGWPPHLINSAAAPRTIQMASLKGLDPEGHIAKASWGAIEITDYMFIDLLPNLKFNKLNNMIPYLKDKTVSLTRSRIVGSILEGKPIKSSWKETRLLLAYLLNPAFVTDHIAYLDQVSSGVDVHEFIDYLVLRIVPKEKEHKVDFRGFGCKTPHDRARSLAQEVNSKHYLSLFSDEQAMTLSELELIKRLYAFRCLEDAYTGHEVLYITLDASSWNNHFRKETVDDLMVNTLSRVFDNDIFSRTHEMYLNTYYYVPDGKVSYHWDGQAGGIEGLNQDSWVIIYIAQIKTCITNLNLKFHILCKGDDFRLAVLIPKKDLAQRTMREYKNLITTTISEKAKGMGHKIKISESFGSERYFMFSKKASIDKIEMPETFRKIQKTHGANNSFIHTLDEFAGSTFSNAHSACKVSTGAMAQYMTALSWFYFYLTQDPLYKTCTPTELLCLSLVPSMCGGFPIIYLHNMYVRAESDLLPPFLDLIKYCEKERRRTELVQMMKRFCVITTDKIESFVQLYKDPYSLPTPRPPLPTSVLRKEIVPALTKMVKNEHVRELLDARDSPEQEYCLRALNSADFLVIKPLAVIYAATPAAIVDELVKKFESSRSVMELLILRLGQRKVQKVLRKVVRTEYKLQQWRVNVLRDTGTHESKNWYQRFYDDCPHKFAYDVREWSWTKPIIGITTPPMHHIMSYTTEIYGDIHDDQHHFTYQISDDLKAYTRDGSQQYCDGGFEPFLGHITSTATLAPQLKFVQKDVILSHVAQLLETLAWAETAERLHNGKILKSNLAILIEALLRLFTNLGIDDLNPFQSKYKGGGSNQHHGRCPNFRTGIMPNSLSNCYTQVSGTTDTHTMLWDNSDHFLFNFLHIYCFTVSVIFSELDVSREVTSPSTIWAVTNNCPTCNDPIHEELYPVTIQEQFVRPIKFTPLVTTNVGETMKEILRESYAIQQQRKILLDPRAHEITFQQACLGVLQHLLTLTLDQATSLQARYGGHTMTEDSRKIFSSLVPKTRQRDIGRTEIRALKPRMVAKDLLIAIYDVIDTQMSYDKNLGKNHLRFVTLPSGEIPWYPVLKQFYDAGTLAELLRECAKLAHQSIVYCEAVPEHAIYSIGHYAIEAMNSIRTIRPQLVLLNNLEPRSIRYALHRYLMQWSWWYVEKNFIIPYEQTKDHNLYAYGLAFCILKTWSIDVVPQELTWDHLANGMSIVQAIDVDFAAIEQLTDETIRSHGGYFLYQYQSRTIKINAWQKETGRNFIEELFDLIEYVREDLDEVKLDVTIASLSSAIAILRNYGFDDQSEGSSENDVRFADQMGDPILFSPCKPRSNVLKIKSVGREDFTTSKMIDPEIPFRWDLRTVYWNHLDRPFGNQTNSMNVLSEIYHYFWKKSKNSQDETVYWSELGAGLGGGCYFFTSKHHNSQGFFMTKPKTLGDATKPDLALSIAEQNGVTIKHNHVKKGIWDLSKLGTLPKMREVHDHNNIIFFNVDKIETSQEFDKFFKITAMYYLQTRSVHGILIYTASFEKFESLTRALSILSLTCSHVYLVNPKSSRCFWNVTIVAWHRKNFPLEEIDWNMDPFLSIVESVGTYMNRMILLTQRSHDFDQSVILRPQIKVDKETRFNLPPMFLSLLMNRAKLSLPDIEAFKLCIPGERAPPPRTVFERLLHVIEQPVRDALKDLKNQLNESTGMTHREADMDYHGRRMTMQDRRFLLEGVMYGIKRGHKFSFGATNSEMLRKFFLVIVESLDNRDKVIINGTEDIFSKKRNFVILHDTEVPIKVNWWTRFVHGYEIILTSIGYCATLYPGPLEDQDEDEDSEED